MKEGTDSPRKTTCVFPNLLYFAQSVQICNRIAHLQTLIDFEREVGVRIVVFITHI